MEVKVTVEDYFSKEELRGIVEDEVRGYVRGMVKDYFKHNSCRDFVEGVARDAYWDAVGQLGEDTLGKVRRQVRKLIPEPSIYSLIGHKYVNGKEVPTHLQQVIDEESEKMRPEISSIRDCVNGRQTQTHGFEWAKDTRRAERTCRWKNVEGTLFVSDCGGSFDRVVSDAYCPNCGARVIEEES